MLEPVTLEMFTPLLHDTFRLSHDAAPDLDLPLELIEATEVRDTGPQHPLGEQRRTPFALVFRGPPDSILPQRSYRLSHATLGTFEVFIVPIGRDAQGVRYEVIFT